MRGVVGGRGGKYEAKARVMEKGYSLKSLMVASRVEAFLCDGGLEKGMVFLGDGRRSGDIETLWKGD